MNLPTAIQLKKFTLEIMYIVIYMYLTLYFYVVYLLYKYILKVFLIFRLKPLTKCLFLQKLLTTCLYCFSEILYRSTYSLWVTGNNFKQLLHQVPMILQYIYRTYIYCRKLTMERIDRVSTIFSFISQNV